MNFKTSVNYFQDCEDYENLKNRRRLFNYSRMIDIFKCLPLYLRHGTEEEKQQYYNEWGYMSLFHPIEEKEETKEHINNIKLYNEEFKRLGKKGKVNDVINSFCYLIKWNNDELDKIIQHDNQDILYRIKNMTLNTPNKSLNTYIFDSYLILCSYDDIIFIYDITEGGRNSRTLINPINKTMTTSRHLNYLIESLYKNDLLSNYIKM